MNQASRPTRDVAAVALAAIVAIVLQRTAWADDFFVNPTGAGGAFSSIQAAINAVPAGTALNRTNIFIAPGVYNETTGANGNLNVNKAFVTFVGQGDSPDDVVIQNNVSGLTGATRLQSSANDFLATNLTFKNTRGDNNGQAVALRNSADRSAFKNVHFIGYQDTLLAENRNRQYYFDSYITGDVDFIFGNATAVFDECIVNSSDGGFVTAPETDVETAVGLVFLNSTLTRNGPPGANANTAYLARPWHWDQGKIPSTIFINTKMDVHVRTAGWDPWNLSGNPNLNPDGTTRFSDFNSMDLKGNPLPIDGNGVPVGRVPWADPMSAAQAAAYTLANIFSGPGFWNANRDLQPEFVGGEDGYTNQAAFTPWDPRASLAALPPIPEPASVVILAICGIALSIKGRQSRGGVV
jgi:pectin methylesterase-like acyl-CoA thioesterase